MRLSLKRRDILSEKLVEEYGMSNLDKVENNPGYPVNLVNPGSY